MAAKLVYPKEKVISISGDGGFLFSAMELETAVRENLSFVHCIWCDGAYNMVKEQQLLKYKREAAVEFGPIDHVKFAESFGAKGFRINQAEELLPTLKKALTLKGPVIIEVPIDYSDNPSLFKTVQESSGN
jgi:acetolactate synthase-1/2/3 large subunit